MSMDKTLFKQKLDKVGYLKRKWSGATPEEGWEEQVLKLFPKDHTCPDCTKLEFVWKHDHWRRKCLVCGEKTVVKTVVTK